MRNKIKKMMNKLSYKKKEKKFQVLKKKMLLMRIKNKTRKELRKRRVRTVKKVKKEKKVKK